MALAAIVAVAKHAVDATLQSGLKAVLDLHVSTAGPWSTQAIEAAYPSGQKWQRYLQVAGEFAQLCELYLTEELAFEIYNENSNNESYGNTAWAERVRALWAAIRAINVKTTLLVGGSFYSGIEGLWDLKASSFDSNTGFVVHNYHPTIFTHQNAAEYTRYVARLHYPPVPSDKTAALRDMAERVDASDLPDADKERIKRDRTRRLKVYFDTPQNHEYITAKIQEVARWQVRNGVAGSRIFVTEFGSHNDHDFPGAALIARMAWAQDVDIGHEAAGFCRTVWNYNSPDYWDITQEDKSWRIRDGFLIALARLSSNVYEPEADELFKKMSVQPSMTDKAVVSETIRQLKYNCLWTKLDALYVFAGGNAVDAPIDWKQGGRADLDPDQLAFVPKQGLVNRLDKPAAFQVPLSDSEGTSFKEDDNHVGLFVIGKTDNRSIIVDCGAGSSLLRLDMAGISTRDAVNQAYAIQGASETHVMVSRTQNDSATIYADGSIIAIEHSGSTIATRRTVKLSFNAPNRASCAILHFGGGFTADDAKIFFTIARFYINGTRRMPKAT